MRHLQLVALALGAAIIVAVPLGLALERARRAAEPMIGALGVLQTIPSIALLAFMIPLLGVGVVPALVALWLYALYPDRAQHLHRRARCRSRRGRGRGSARA